MKKTKKNKRGFLLYAFGNKDLDYGKLAVCCALSIKTNLKNNHITVITDEGTKKWLESSVPEKVLNTAFDTIVLPKEKFRSGKRRHFDSPWITFKAEFNNQNRVMAYKYSPYDETIMLDTDYIVMNDNFDNVWGSQEDLMINNKAIDLQGKRFGSLIDRRISKHGIPMYWATVVYFKKSEYSETFFDLVDYVREEYNFFQFLYEYSAGFYRNDFSFSIAAHILNGYIRNGTKSLPDDVLLMSYQKDSIAGIKNTNEIMFLAHKPDEPWITTLVNIKDMNIHIMNKRELLRISSEYIDLCMEKL
jgi:hypothetical protein